MQRSQLMKIKPVAMFLVIFFACGEDLSESQGGSAEQIEKNLIFVGETSLKNLRQLTFGGENAEAYFSPDNNRLIFQTTREPFTADQIFTMDTDGANLQLVSTGKGQTTCGYFFPDYSRILYASTHVVADEPPERVSIEGGNYVWPVYTSYDIFSADIDGSNMKRLTSTDGYDAEATIAPDGSKIVFTSARDGDLELYTMNLDGSDQKRLTNAVGYDGGAFFSFDGKKIVYRAHYPTDPAEIKKYQEYLKQGLIQPTQLDIYVMNADGSNVVRITDNGAANFCPFFHPDGNRIIFASNMDADGPQKRNFELYLINIDGTGLRRLTYNPTFDGFPMFSADGKKLVFCSNRNAQVEGETNVFICDFEDEK